MGTKITYENTNQRPVFYKDAFLVYKNLILDKIVEEGLPKDIVKIVNNDLINVNRAPLIVIKRVSSSQPPNINNVNEKILDLGSTKVVEGKSMQAINMAIESYGNSYLEAERLGSLVQESIIITSINKIRVLSNNKIVGHEYLGWSGTSYINSNSKLMVNRIDIRLTIVLEYSTQI